MRPFIAFICKLPDARFCALFPDLPGCTSTGETIAETLVNAESALADYCHEQQELAAQIPPPSLMHELGPNQPGGLLALIPPPPDVWQHCGFIRSE
jgi:predicted RNase H-like HicB family nuclease